MTATPAERETPASRESEQAVLGAVFISPRLLSELADARTDDFLFPSHRDILDAMRAVEAIDPITVGDEMRRRGTTGRLEGGEGYFLALTNAGSSEAMFPHHVAIVREKALARRLIQTCAETMSRAYGGAPVADLTADHRVQLAGLELDGRAGGPVSLADSIDGALDTIERRAANPNGYQVLTGIHDFDEQIGGMRAGNLVVIAGRPGKGKTAYCEGIALHNGSLNVPVLIFSLEMKRQELIERALASESGIDGRRIVSARLDLRDWQELHPAAEKLRAASVWIDDRKLTTSRICSEAQRWREMVRRARRKAGFEDDRALVEIDYLGLVRPDHRGENRNLEVAAMSAAFKGLAGDLDCPVMLLSQLNRASEKDSRKPILSDLRDSGAVEADADMVLFPWREERGEHAVPVEYESASIIVGKNRNGPIGEVACRFRPSTMQFLNARDSRWDGERTTDDGRY